MLKIKHFTLLLLFAAEFSTNVHAQQITQTDYERAVSLLWQNVSNKKAFRLQVYPIWFADSTGFWYRYQSKDGKQYMKVEFDRMKIEGFFDHNRLAAALSEELNEPVKSNDLPLESLEYISENQLRFRTKGKSYLLDLTNYQLREEKPEENRNAFESTSPDGKWIAYTKDYNLFVKSTENEEVKQLSHSGYKNYEYASYHGWGDIMEGEGGERPQHFSVSWSPDSKWIYTNICDLRSANKMYLLDYSIDTLYRPKLLSYYRGSPGDTGMVYMIPVLFDILQGKEIKPDLPRNTHINAVSASWSKTGDKLYANYASRGYQNRYVKVLDMRTMEIQELIHEQSNTNIPNFKYWLLEEKNRILFASNGSGWRQLYVFDLNTKAIAPLAHGDYYVEDVLHIDEKKGFVYFTASGKEAGRNPYHTHLYRAVIDKKEVKLLTPENLHHEVSIEPGGKYFVDNMSTAQTPTTTVLRDTKTGRILLELSKADVEDLIAMNWQAPETFTAIAQDGKTEIFGALWKPINFDPNKKYPVIDHSYTGPHTQVFPNNFMHVLSDINQATAELGFVVVMIDGMGSSGRSKAFQDISYKNMGRNLTDHVLAIQQLAEKYSWIDAERVGIFGHSAGGYDACHALLEFPDFYKVGVASSANHDHRMEKAWWPEMYMGWPVDSAYHKQSNITMAANLKGKLLLVHGGIDENVNPSATFKLAEYLVKADKEFDLLIFPSQRHGYNGKYHDYFLKKRWNYFVEHLLGAKPIWDFSLEDQSQTVKLNCKLPRVVDGPIALGFPKVEGLAPSIGKLNMTVLFVDFDDVPATKSVDSVFSIINPIAPEFFDEMSYGRLQLNLNPHLEWLRLSKPSSHYGEGIYEFLPHRDFIQEAVNLADSKVDFSDTDVVLVMANPDAEAIAMGPVFKSLDPQYKIKTAEKDIAVGITSGYDLNYWGGLWLGHETGHTFGLPDLYLFEDEKQLRYVGTFGIMGISSGNAPGHFAFERWVLGWIDDNQIYCHDDGEVVIEIEAIEKKGGIKAVVVPLDTTRALVVESRRKIGFDKKTREGALVYLVNTALPGGSGPIQVKPGVKSEYEFLQDAPMIKGEVYTFENVTIEVVGSGKESDKVKVIVK